MEQKRKGIIVWMYSLSARKALQNYGVIYYVSRKMKYAIMYVNKASLDKTIEKISKLRSVKSVELSHRDEIDMNFEEKIGHIKEMKEEE